MIQLPLKKKKWIKAINKIVDQSFACVNPTRCVSEVIRLEGKDLKIAETMINLESEKNIFLLGVGKAVLPMAKAVEEEIGIKITGGLLITKHFSDKYSLINPNIQIHVGGHPIPDERSVDCGKKLEKFVKRIGQNDLVINLISGGGSALMTLPYDGISLVDYQSLSNILIKCGATINEINTIRKHIDRLKGGGLARMVCPAQVITLILSDVIGDEISTIASGPTVFDSTTYFSSLEILRKYKIEKQIPQGILNHLNKGLRGEIPETVKFGDKAVENVTNIIIGNLSSAIIGAQKAAQELGFHTIIFNKNLVGEAREVGRNITLEFLNAFKRDKHSKFPICFIAGGELTVTVKGTGKGGRNQELVLAAIELLQNYNDFCLLSIATDGEDGPTDAAGAFVTEDSLKIAKEKGLDPQKYLENNDSYTFFDLINGLIKIGSTGTNVNDLLFFFGFK